MIALLLAAQMAATTPQVQTQVIPGEARRTTSDMPNAFRQPGFCQHLTTRTLDRHGRAVPETLNRQPRAALELAVDRTIGGCHMRTVVGYSLEDAPRAWTITPEDARSRRR